jgi:hypothetical protein
MSTACYTAMVILVNIKIGLQTTTWIRLTHIVFL